MLYFDSNLWTSCCWVLLVFLKFAESKRGMVADCEVFLCFLFNFFLAVRGVKEIMICVIAFSDLVVVFASKILNIS